MDKYAETKQVISDMAAVKMAMNSHKGNIEDLTHLQAVQAIRGEVEELEEALEEGGMLQVIEEAADIMNFLIATVHQQIHLYRTRK
jgi:hypothetical protein